MTLTPDVADDNGEARSSSKLPLRPYKIEVTINPHQRLGEIIKVIFSDQVDIESVSNLCTALQESAHVIEIPIHYKNLRDESKNGIDYAQLVAFVPTFSLGAGSVRDHAFPSLPWNLRRQIQCDGVGVFSLTHERAATRTAKLLHCFVHRKTDHVVIDGMAGIGGNTLGFLKYWNTVTAVEIDPDRASMLQANVELWKTWQHERPSSVQKTVRVKTGCLIDFIAGNLGDSAPKSNKDILLFLDPPWGGPQYQQQILDQDSDIIIPPSLSAQSLSYQPSSPCIVDCRVPWRFSSAVIKLVESNMFQVIALKLPNGYDETLFLNPLVHGNDMGMERTHPFRFHFGSSVKLLVLVRNMGDDPMFANGPVGLDRMIRNIMEWHNSLDLQEDHGCREHRPEFYDWEKCRWIMLKKWKGSKESPSSSSVL